MSVWPPQGTDVSIRPPRVPTLAKGPHLSGYSKGEHLVLGKNIAHDMKSGAEGAHFFGALLLTFSFDKHSLWYFLFPKNHYSDLLEDNITLVPSHRDVGYII